MTRKLTDANGMPFWPAGTSLSRDSLLVAAALIPSVLVFAMLRLVPALDLHHASVMFHLVIVSGLSGCALVIALLAAVAAGRTGHRSLTLLGAACLTVGVFMLGHGLATPGIADRPMNMWVGRFPVIALAGFAAFLAAALRRPADRPGLIDPPPPPFPPTRRSSPSVSRLRCSGRRPDRGMSWFTARTSWVTWSWSSAR